MKLTERIQRWTNAQQLEFDLHGFAAVNKFEQEHLSHIHGDYLLTLACNPYEPLKEVVRLQITCTANDFADRTWIAHRERLEAANSVITLAAGQSMPLLERLWRVTTAERISDEQINWDYVKAFKQAHGEDGGYSIVARSNYLGTLTGIKLICTPGVISPEVAQKHAQGRIQDLPYTNVYPCAATNVLAPTHGRAA